MAVINRGCCARCGAWLRRARPRAAELCDPCRRLGPDPRRELPSGFYFQDPMVAALAAYDFGAVFRRVRAVTGWSQQTLGELVGTDQARISEIERGQRRLRDVALVARAATGLRIPPVLLGFGDHGTTVGQAGVDDPKVVSWVDRRDFVQHIGALTLGTAGVVGLDIDRLIALLPHAEPAGTRHVGAADVGVIEQATAAFLRQDFATGAGPIRDLAVAQLRSVLPLLDAQATSEVRARLSVAIAELATKAGWMSFEVQEHDDARRLWMIGLDVARAADHPQSSDLTVFLLNDLAQQAVHLNRPQEALSLVHLGHVAAAGSHPVSAATRCCLASIQATAHAARGDAGECDRALGQATEHFSSIDPARTPSLVAHVGDADFSGKRGVAQHTLALSGRDPDAASQAVSLLCHAVDQLGPDYARLRVRYLTDLAGAHAIAGDVDTAVTVGHQAVDAVMAVSSPRAYDRLRVLNTVLEPLHTNADVAQLRDRLPTTAV